MKILITLFPVFFMMALGCISRIAGVITQEQKDGARSLVSLQNTLIMVNGAGTNVAMLKLSAYTGAIIWAAVTAMSIWAMIRKKKENL